MIRKIILAMLLIPVVAFSQINTEKVMTMAKNAIYFEDYILSIRYFNQIINAKPYLYEPYFYRAIAKISLEDYKGAELDCDEAIDRNPFVVGAYQVRGMSRIKQGKYDEAIEDYKIALKLYPEDIPAMHNMALANLQKKDYDSAVENLNNLLSIRPKYSSGLLMRSEAFINKKDTVAAIRDIEEAIKIDSHNHINWLARGMINLQQKKYKEAELDLNKSLEINPDNASAYINRALARVNQRNLKGALSDYDLSIKVEPNNFIAHYNRGLMRARIGDNNRAIEDFNFVIETEPDNMMAIFNRGILLAETGNHKGAIEDFTTVLSKYPDFLEGYYRRAESRKKIGDKTGYEKDSFVLMKAEIEGYKPKKDKNADKKNESIRKEEENNIDSYSKVLVSKESEYTRQYENEYRGKVQNKNIEIKIEPMFVLTYYKKYNDIIKSITYNKTIEQINSRRLLPKSLHITNAEAPLSEDLVSLHFEMINDHSLQMMEDSTNIMITFARAIDFYLIQDFESAISDLTNITLRNDKFFPAYFMRSVIKSKLIEYTRSENKDNTNKDVIPIAITYETSKKDLDRTIELAPDFEYAYYNRGNIFFNMTEYTAALIDYTKAIDINKDFAEAYYNRGITNIQLGNIQQAVSDLSKAGELGIFSSYNIIKRIAQKSKQ